MNPCCDQIAGGEVYITLDRKNGKAGRYEAIGDVSIMPAPTEVEANSSSGGRLVVTHRSKPITASFDLANLCGADPADLINGCNVDITVVEHTRGFRHLFSQAVITGNPELNLSTGVWSGLQVAVASKNYSKVNQSGGTGIAQIAA